MALQRLNETHLTASLLVLMLLAGCEGDPTDPIDPDGPVPSSGIVVFARADYRGPYRIFVNDVTDLRRVDDEPQPAAGECAAKVFGQEYWTDCVSSIRVADGWQAVVYQHDNFRGDSLTVTSDIPDLSRFPLPPSVYDSTRTWGRRDLVDSSIAVTGLQLYAR